MHEGRPLIAHVADALALQCDAVVVCGRSWGVLPALEDCPGPGLGPMAGLCAALHRAARDGHAFVLSAPCDLLELPVDLAAQLQPAPAVADGQWLVGLWPTAIAARLEGLLGAEGAISARRWAADSNAGFRPIPFIRNVNRPCDLN